MKSDSSATPNPTPKPPAGWRDPLDPSQAANVKTALALQRILGCGVGVR